MVGGHVGGREEHFLGDRERGPHLQPPCSRGCGEGWEHLGDG